MPPFLGIRLKALLDHRRLENVAARPLRLGQPLCSMRGNRAKEIDPASHVDFLAGLLVDQRKIHRATPGMAGFGG
ncbi:hypothetical protein D3C72_2326710 [compost metagenome]